jgi:beta-lactamase regulating signal transducer with metallopeptidase domain
MSTPLIDWLADTLIWTAGLIALVLVLRRPITRYFGPQMAYALWLLPAIRLVIPPIELPAWFAPANGTIGAAAMPTNTLDTFVVPSTTILSQPSVAQSPWPLLELVACAWLVGACSFLFLRFRGYFDMRRNMLADAREVGRAGKIRLVETPATTAPLAFGVWDKVIALPQGFMALPDREARDLAVSHELAHHRGHDLLANILVQPLFAVHWFNPLAYVGWLALRRDQEAACDARVMAVSAPENRATYASVIASFAAGPNVALAAPMACPVLGDKSIIHRLRSLQMKDLSTRRRVAGRTMIVLAALAVPLTASVTYAEEIASAVPVAPVAPLPPSASGVVPPAPPVPPVPPLPPEAPVPPLPMMLQSATDADAEAAVEKKITKKVTIYRTEDSELTDGTSKMKVIREIRAGHDGEELSDEQIEDIMSGVREGLAEADIAAREVRTIGLKFKQEHSDGKHTVIEMDCDGDGVASEKKLKDGQSVVMICESRILAQALTGLKQARKEILSNTELPEKLRKQVLRELDEKIENWADSKG